MKAGPASILVTDFDGTITERDFVDVALERLVASDAPDYWGLFREGRVSHFEAMRGSFAHIRGSEPEIDDALREMRADPDLGDAVARLRNAGWDVVAASAGSSWYIDRILRAAGVDMPVYANSGRFEPDRGLFLTMPFDSPYFSASHGIDKEAVVRDALARYERVAYAGDGPPDLQPALLVESGLRFARGWLAAELERLGAEYRPYSRWSQIAVALSSGR